MNPITIEQLRRLAEHFRMAPILTRIEVNDIADLRRYMGAPPKPTDVLGVGNLGGVPVVVDADVPIRMARLIKSDGSTEMVPL